MDGLIRNGLAAGAPAANPRYRYRLKGHVPDGLDRQAVGTLGTNDANSLDRHKNLLKEVKNEPGISEPEGSKNTA